MIYGKAEFRISNGELPSIFLTVTGDTISIKQGNDLIRLEFEQAQEFHKDFAAGLAQLAPAVEHAKSGRADG